MSAFDEEVFTVYGYDINTNSPLAQIPATGLTFGCRLNDSGPISFSVSLQSSEVRQNLGTLLAYDGGPFACYVDLNGVIVWGGIAWTTSYSKASGKMDFGGNEWLSWTDQRTQAADYSQTTYPGPTGIDPAALVQLVINDAQSSVKSGPGASVGLQVAAILGTNPPNLIPGYPKSQRTTLSQIISDMTKVVYPATGGIDVTVFSQWDTNGNPKNTLNVWTPRAGRVAGNSGLIFGLDGTIDYTWPTDASQMGTTITLTGGGSGTSMPAQTVNAPGGVGALGQPPRLDKTVSFTQIQTLSQISAMAGGVRLQYGSPLKTPTVVLPTLGLLGSFIPGDDVRIYTAGDERFPSGKDEYWRIISYDVRVPDQGVPQFTATLNQPPIF